MGEQKGGQNNSRGHKNPVGGLVYRFLKSEGSFIDYATPAIKELKLIEEEVLKKSDT
jgi:hypothetical protein